MENILNFIRQYYTLLIMLSLGLIVIITAIIVIFKKQDQTKVSSFAITKEKHEKLNQDFSNQAIIFRESIQDYKIRFFDSKNNNFFESKTASSKIGIKSIYQSILSNINSDNYRVHKDLDDSYYLYVYDDKSVIGYSYPFKNKEDSDNVINELKGFKSIELSDTQIKRDGIKTYKSEVSINKKMNKHVFNHETVLDSYRILIEKDNLTKFISIPLLNKSDIKKMKEEIYKALSKKEFIIVQDLNNDFYYSLKTSTGYILSISKRYKDLEVLYKDIDELLTII